MKYNVFLKQMKQLKGFTYSMNKLERQMYIQYQKDLIKKYYDEICDHDTFQEIGYFFQKDKLIPSMKEHADYRLIRCPKCKKIVVLTKQGQLDWDNSICSRKIKILKRQNME